MVREELKRQVSEAGRHFSDDINIKCYRKKWIDIKTLVNDVKVERLIHVIDFYNKELNRWLESRLQKDNYRQLAYGYYCSLEGMLYALRDVDYFKPDKQGDINPFIDYCWDCWLERCPIDFDEYEQIKSFFED